MDCGRPDLNYAAEKETTDCRGFRHALGFEGLLGVALLCGLRCSVCRLPFSADAAGVVAGAFEFAHIIPKSHRGTALATNAKLLCRICHGVLTVRAVSRCSGSLAKKITRCVLQIAEGRMVQRITTWRKRFVLQFRKLNGTASDVELLDAMLKAFAAEAEFADVKVAAAATGDVYRSDNDESEGDLYRDDDDDDGDDGDDDGDDDDGDGDDDDVDIVSQVASRRQE